MEAGFPSIPTIYESEGGGEGVLIRKGALDWYCDFKGVGVYSGEGAY